MKLACRICLDELVVKAIQSYDSKYALSYTLLSVSQEENENLKNLQVDSNLM